MTNSDHSNRFLASAAASYQYSEPFLLLDKAWMLRSALRFARDAIPIVC